MNNRIGIKDIAKKAGVSKGTVDRVLHNRGNVSPIAREKVNAAMKELDYVPNVIASALASKKLWKIAVLIPDPKKDPFWNQPKSGILKAKKALRDYRVTIDFFLFRDADTNHFKECADEILSKDYHGLLISPSYLKEGQKVLERCEAKHLPYIQINTFLERKNPYFLSFIGQDSYASGMLAAKLLNFGTEEGATSMILHLEKEAYNAKHLLDKEKGFKDFFAKNKKRKIKILRGSYGDIFDKKGLHQYLKKTLETTPNVQGIFVTTSKLFHIVPILKKLGRTDIKLVGFDLIENNLKYLYDDKIHFLINQNPMKQGFMGIMNLFNHLILKKEIKQLQLLPLDVVMRENVQYYLEEKNEEIHLVF
ncbi:MAG: substrate-binding domain-containing protein [Saprospiraceae bacterium]